MMTVVATWELRRERVDGVGADHVEEHEREALGTDDAAARLGRNDEREIGIDGGDEHQRVAGAQPGERRGERGIVGGGKEPADVVAVALADDGLGIVDDAVDLFVFLRHGGKGEDADDHDGTADEPSFCKMTCALKNTPEPTTMPTTIQIAVKRPYFFSSLFSIAVTPYPAGIFPKSAVSKIRRGGIPVSAV